MASTDQPAATAPGPPVGPPPPQYFTDAANLIDADINQDGSGWSKGLKLVTDTDPKQRAAFLDWYIKKQNTDRDTMAGTLSNTPSLTMVEFVTKLKAINFKDPASIDAFYMSINPIIYAPPPDPIKLGTYRYPDNKGGVTFYLELGNCALKFYEPDTSNSSAEYQPNVVQFMTAKRETDTLLRAGMHLGNIVSCSSGFDSTPTAMRDNATETALQAFVNPTDKSIWAVVAQGGSEYSDDDMFAQINFSGWRALGLDEDSAHPFTAICLYDKDTVAASTGTVSSLSDIGANRDIFAPAMLATARQKPLLPYLIPVGQQIPESKSVVASDNRAAPASA